MLDNILQLGFLINLLSGTIRIASPILFAALGELVVERSGILNLNVEGAMTMGAFVGFAVARQTGSLWAGVLAGALAGVAMSMLMAFMSSTLKIDQTVTGLALNIFASGLSFYLYRIIYKDFISGNMPTVSPFIEVPIPLLSQIPIIGPALFSQHVLSYIGLFMVPLIFIFLYRTKYGLALRCMGENPRTVDMKGVSVTKYQYMALAFGGFMSGVGGCFLTLASAGLFVNNIAAGRGWIAIAIVIFGSWRPFNILWATLFFAFLSSLQVQIQSAGFPFPYQLVLILPYVVTILALIFSRRRYGAPLSLGIPYIRE
ncbi:MAG: ABC transporter permease [Leptolinea sp.]